jgi:hypothetical protein
MPRAIFWMLAILCAGLLAFAPGCGDDDDGGGDSDSDSDSDSDTDTDSDSDSDTDTDTDTDSEGLVAYYPFDGNARTGTASLPAPTTSMAKTTSSRCRIHPTST